MGLGREADILISVYLTLVLDHQESRKFYIQVRNEAAVDACEYVICAPCFREEAQA